ncbi:MAG: 50S ribosomal protein L13 [Actinomycetia bacterium]|nr:50S ribosomal protein L13 [Actinomycetes bacterium]MCQ3804933.1 50S ribosomal protein L13 [Acidimicrobiia bacterium]
MEFGLTARTTPVISKTYSPSAEHTTPDWWVVDASDLPLGRLSSEIAKVIRGKHKPTFAPHVDGGDFVVVVNAERVGLTASKSEQKVYYRHSGYPGGIKAESFQSLIKRRPQEVIERAVRGMLPKNRLGRKMFRKLKVYAGPSHPHAAQKPVALEFNIRKVDNR